MYSLYILTYNQWLAERRITDEKRSNNSDF